MPVRPGAYPGSGARPSSSGPRVRPTILLDWLHLTVAVRIAPHDIDETMTHLEKTWQHFIPDRPFEVHFLDQAFESKYWAEERQSRILAMLSILAVLIACLGLYGLASFAAEQHTREMGVRRVLGASVPNLVVLLSSESVKAVLVANVIAWPIAWYAMGRWLAGYPYTVELGPVLFALVGLAVLAIALTAFAHQAIRAASANPVSSLRYE